MAALSVEYCMGGMKIFHPLASLAFSSACLSPELAETPPAIATSRYPLRVLRFLVFLG